MSDLATKTCEPCRGSIPRLEGEELERLHHEVPGWKIVEGHHLYKVFHFPDFKSALEFVNRVGEVAEEQGHHPAIYFTWGKVEITIWTHKIDGLVEADFILAAKIDALRK